MYYLRYVTLPLYIFDFDLNSMSIRNINLDLALKERPSQTVDFANLNQTQQIIPTGQSGLPNSKHYDDQAELYHNGDYRTTWFDEKYIRENKEFRRLTLLPMK